MKRKTTSLFIILVILTSTIQMIAVLSPPLRELQGNESSDKTTSSNNANTQPDKITTTSSNAYSRGHWYDIFGSKQQPGSHNFEKWDTNDLSWWRNSAYLNDGKTRLIVGISNNGASSLSDMSALMAKYEARIVNTVSIKNELEAIVVEIPLASVKSFSREAYAINPAIYVEPDMKVQATYVPNDPDWSIQWGPQKIQADWAWNTTQGSHELLVAVVDTGVNYSHPDIAANYVPLGYDWVNNDNDPYDDYGHGTHCTGIIAAVTNNNIGIAGIAQVSVMAEKVLDNYGSGMWDWVANGIINATDCGARIISMSLGGYGDSQLVHEAVKYAYDAGVLVIAAAGNDNTNMKSYPAAYDEVVAVAATDQYDAKAYFSNWGDWIELAAPGVDIYSTVPNGYETHSGTSMACPHVSGVAGLVWSRFPSMTRDWVRMWLHYTADDLGTPGFDQYYGYGRINARMAVEQTPPEHEILLQNLQTPYYVGPGELVPVNVTVANYGLNNESSVEVQLLANSILVDSKIIGFLGAGSLTKVGLSWNATAEGIYNLTAYAVPVLGEVATQNNALSAEVKVMVLSGILIVSDDDGGAKISGTSLSQFGCTLTAAGYNYLVWNESTMGNPTITFLAHFGLVIWTCGDYWSWAVDQVDAVTLQSYLAQGGNILLEGEDIGFSHGSDSFMVNVAHAIFAVDSATAPGLTVTDSFHPVTFDLPASFTWQTTPIYPDGVTPTNGGAEVIQYTGTSYTAVTVFDGKSLGSGSTVYYAFPLSCLEQAERDILAVNSVGWLLGIEHKYNHELGVRVDAPALIEPGYSSLLNATVRNIGLNAESDVQLQLLIDDAVVDSVTIPELGNGTSFSLRYLWTPTFEGTYNVTAYALPVPDENSTTNNVATRLVIAQYPLIKPVPGQWAYYIQQTYNMSTGQLLYWQYINYTYAYYTKPYVINITMTITYQGGYSYTYWMTVNTMNRWIEQGYGQGTWYTGWVQTSITIGSTLNLLFGLAIVNGSKVIIVGGYPIDCWQIPLYYQVFYYDKVSGLWTYEDQVQPPYYVVQSTLLATNVPIGVPPEHELAAELEAPDFLEPGASSELYATVHNLGLETEYNVSLSLIIDEVTVAGEVIPALLSGESYTISYFWTPPSEGTYNVTAYVQPVPGEDSLANNVAARVVSVQYPLINPIPGQWAYYLLEEYNATTGELIATGYLNLSYAYYVRPYVINVTITEYIGGYNYAGWMTVNTMNRLVEQGVWEGMWYPGWVQTGITIGSTLNLLYGPTSVNGSKVIQVGEYPIDCWQIPYDPYYALYYDKVSGLWVHMDFAIPYLISEELTLLATNVPIGPPPEHELAAELQAPAFLEPSASSELYATVHNLGLETEYDVSLSLIIDEVTVAGAVIPALPSGESYTISYTWTPSIEGIYNVTAYVQPVPGEASLKNNVATKFVTVMEPLIRPIEGQYANYVLHYINATTGEEIYGGWWNITYGRYISPYQVNVTMVQYEAHFDYTSSVWLRVNTFTRMIETINGMPVPSGYWYFGWIETSITIGSSILLLYGPATVVDNEVIYVGGHAIDCWEVASSMYGTPIECWYDKASGLCLGMKETMPDQIDLPTLTETNVPLGFNYAHDLTVTLDVPQAVGKLDSTTLNAKVYNTGMNDESSVTLQLIVNGTIVRSETIAALQASGFYALNYTWTPTELGSYNITTYAYAVPGETYVANNVRTKWVACVFSWARSYGGTSLDYANSIQQTSDGGYIVVGETYSFGAGYDDIWVLKLDSFGTVTWQKTYGGSGDDVAYSVRQTSDSGYIVAGYTYSFGAGASDAWVLKLNSAGSVVWQKTYGGSSYDWAMCVQQTSDGGYIVVGETYSFGAGYGDIWVLKLDPNGSVTWQKTYGGSSTDYAWSIQQTSDGGYIVGGATYSFGAGDGDIWVLKLDPLGVVTWQKTYGGTDYDEAEWIQQTSDNGYIVAGLTGSSGVGSWDVWVLKLDPNGSVTWQNAYGGNYTEVANFVEQTSDGGYIVAGWTNSSGAGGVDVWVLKLDPNGSVTWQKTYGGNLRDVAVSAQQTSDGGYAVVGWTRSFGVVDWDSWIVKLGPGGDIVWDSDSGASTHTTSVVPSCTSATIVTTSAIPANSTAMALNTSAIPQDTLAIIRVQAPDMTPPATIVDLATSNPTDSTITLTWTAPGDYGNVGTATGYILKYSTSGPITDANWDSATTYTQSWKPLSAGGSESHTVTGLSGDTTYWFAIKAFDEVPNQSGVSNSPSGRTTDIIRPAAISDLTISVPTQTTLTLTWTAPGDNGMQGTATGYVVKYSTTGPISEANWSIAMTFDQSWAPLPAGSTESHIVTGLSADITYWFAVKALDEVPNYSEISNSPCKKTSDITAPTLITDLATVNPTSSSVTLIWTAPGDNGMQGTAAGYVVKYSTTGLITEANWTSATTYDQSWMPLAGGTTETHVITGLSGDTQYWFAVKAFDEVPNYSGVSNSPSGRTTDIIPPAAISDLTISVPTQTTLTLTWTAPGDNGMQGTATGYVVKYSTTGPITAENWGLATTYSQSWTPLSAGGSESHTVTGLSADTTYWFAVKAFDEVPYYSGISNSVSGNTSDLVAPASITDLATSSPTSTSLTLTWTAPGDNVMQGTATGYVVKYSTTGPITAENWDSTATYSQSWKPLGGGNTEAHVLTGLSADTTYWFAIRAFDEVSNCGDVLNSPSGKTSDLVPPAPIDALAISNVTQTSLTLTWTAPGDNGMQGTAADYIVKYSTTGPITEANWNSATTYTQSWTPLPPGSTESHLITGLTPSTTYWFAIKTSDEIPNYSDVSNSPSGVTATWYSTPSGFFEQYGFSVRTNATGVVVIVFSGQPSGTNAPPYGLQSFVYMEIRGNLVPGSHTVALYLYYDRAKVQQLGLNESSLQLYALDTMTNLWRAIPGTTEALNSTHGVITVYLNHFSYFAIFGSLPSGEGGELVSGIPPILIVGIAAIVIIIIVAVVVMKRKTGLTAIK